MKTPEIINGKVVVRWFSRGRARIPVFEDGSIGVPNKASDISRSNYQKAKYDIADEEHNKIYNKDGSYNKEYNDEKRNNLRRNYEKELNNHLNRLQAEQEKGTVITNNLEGKHIESTIKSNNKIKVNDNVNRKEYYINSNNAPVAKPEDNFDKTYEIPINEHGKKVGSITRHSNKKIQAQIERFKNRKR